MWDIIALGWTCLEIPIECHNNPIVSPQSVLWTYELIVVLHTLYIASFYWLVFSRAKAKLGQCTWSLKVLTGSLTVLRYLASSGRSVTYPSGVHTSPVISKYKLLALCSCGSWVVTCCYPCTCTAIRASVRYFWYFWLLYVWVSYT